MRNGNGAPMTDNPHIVTQEHDPICMRRFDKYQTPCKECEIIRATREAIAAAIEARHAGRPVEDTAYGQGLRDAAQIARDGGSDE